MFQAELLRPADLTPPERSAWEALRMQTPLRRSPLLSFEFAHTVAALRDDAAVAGSLR